MRIDSGSDSRWARPILTRCGLLLLLLLEIDNRSKNVAVLVLVKRAKYRRERGRCMYHHNEVTRGPQIIAIQIE